MDWHRLRTAVRLRTQRAGGVRTPGRTSRAILVVEALAGSDHGQDLFQTPKPGFLPFRFRDVVGIFTLSAAGQGSEGLCGSRIVLQGGCEFCRHAEWLVSVGANCLAITLQRDGFPVGTLDTRAILKDCFERPDGEFKAAVIEHLRHAGAVVGAFDNEPGLCNMFKEAFPEAIVAWLDTSHAPGAPALRQDVLRTKDFVALADAEN